MKAITKVLSGAAVALMMGLCACSSDEPTPAPAPEPDIPDVPVMPEHPDKDWKGEFPHGFITDATVIDMPINERGYLEFFHWNGTTHICEDEVVIDRTPVNQVNGNSLSGASKYAVWGGKTRLYSNYIKLDGIMADPFENKEEYIRICKQHRFRPASQFSDFEELMGFRTPEISGYYSTEVLTCVDLITEKYFDRNHPAGSSMKLIDDVGAFINVMPAMFDFWRRGETGMGGPGWFFGLGSTPYDPKEAAYPCCGITLMFAGFPEEAGEYPMTLKVTMNGGEKVLERKFIIKYVDKK